MIYEENIKISKKGISFIDKDGKKLSLGSALKKAGTRMINWYKDLNLMLLHLSCVLVPLHTVRKVILRACGVKLGKNSVIHMGCRFFDPGNVAIGSDTIIGDHAFLDGRDKLIIGDHVDIASGVMIYNSEHDINSSDFHAINEPVFIEDYVFIGPRVIILPGVTVKKASVVAAGAVVTKDVDEYKIVAGVPATVIGERIIKDPSYRLGRARLFQ